VVLIVDLVRSKKSRGTDVTMTKDTSVVPVRHTHVLARAKPKRSRTTMKKARRVVAPVFVVRASPLFFAFSV